MFVSAAGTACFTAKVVDESGKPLQGVAVVGGFYQKTPLRGLTDNNGEFTMKNRGVIFWEAGFGVDAPGCYESHAGYTFNPVIVGGKWQPWNPVVTAVVRRIVNPIPMYAKRVATQLPSTTQPVGYDLAVGDWVAPFGNGKTNDFIFEIISRRVVAPADFNATLQLSFLSGSDGMQRVARPNPYQGATFAWLYAAPEDGYNIKSNRMDIGYLPSKPFYQTNDAGAASCYFRVRSFATDAGKIVSAYYGKMPGFISFDPRGVNTATIQFTYYLNPTPNDRNMEFYPKHNLLKNLKSTEEVRTP